MISLTVLLFSHSYVVSGTGMLYLVPGCYGGEAKSGSQKTVGLLFSARSEPPSYLPNPGFTQYMYFRMIFHTKNFVTRDDTQPLSSALLARASLFSKHIDSNSLFAHIYCN